MRPSYPCNPAAYLVALIIVYLGVDVVQGDVVDPFVSSNAVGINYGRVADNLPSPSKAVELIQSIKAGYVKIYDADPQVLTALSNTSLPVVITLANEDIPGIVSSSSAADQWIETNVIPYYPSTKISMIMVGNEILSNTQIQSVWSQLVPAMQSIHSSLVKKQLDSLIKVTTSVAMDAFESSYPPSNGSFTTDIASSVMQPMLSFLNATDSYFFLDVYPFFAWSSNPVNISLDYALFGEVTTQIKDGSLDYSNMLDAQLDAAVAAMTRLGYPQVKLAISETGWPTKGDSGQLGTNVGNASDYNRRLVNQIVSNAGTPRRPKTFFPTFIFALFNEDQKSGATTERNWGLFNPDGTPVYAMDLSGGTNESEYSGAVVRTTKSADAPVSSASSSLLWCVANIVVIVTVVVVL